MSGTFKDRYGRETRSYVMSRIRGSDTGPELRLRRALWRAGIRGHRIQTAIPGRPDVVISRVRLAVFVDGCFWHSCPQCRIRVPVSNRPYWAAKLKRNFERDRRVRKELRSLGWNVIRIWEHEIRDNLERCTSRLLTAIRKPSPMLAAGSSSTRAGSRRRYGSRQT